MTKQQNFTDLFAPSEDPRRESPDAEGLTDGSRIAVLGGGPAGSFFSYFLLDILGRMGVSVQVDIFEKRIFTKPGPIGCNMCGGIISESLVQSLAAEGIMLPPTIVERGIDSYILHMDVGSTRIDTPIHEKRIAAIHRGAGPKDVQEAKWGSFDGYLLDLARGKGANLIQGQVEKISVVDGRPALTVKGDEARKYDLLAVCVGVNSPTLKLFADLGIGYTAPKTTKTYISEFFLGEETVDRYLGSSMHVFLLNVPRVEFAALIPKGDYATFCMLGDDIDDEIVRHFLASPQVRQCLPPGWEPPVVFCHCAPKINVGSAQPPFADRMVFIGDCGATRLYKDGIGAAYRTAKAAATTAAFHGLTAEHFRKNFLPVCESIEKDNAVGRLIFVFTRIIQRLKQGRRGVLDMVVAEQRSDRAAKRMSTVMWDTFTGSAPYGEIFLRTLRPGFILNLVKHTAAGLFPGGHSNGGRANMEELLRKPGVRNPRKAPVA